MAYTVMDPAKIQELEDILKPETDCFKGCMLSS